MNKSASKSGSNAKRRKPFRKFRQNGKTASPNVEIQHRRPPQTPNGKLISDLLIARNVKGDYRDYVMLAGNRLVDWLGSHEMFTPDGEPVGVEGVVLIHKSRIRDVVGDKFAEKFWDFKLKRRVIPSQAERNPNAARRTD